MALVLSTSLQIYSSEVTAHPLFYTSPQRCWAWGWCWWYGVNLAELTMSVSCYPMGATIGCGLQNVDTFSQRKTQVYLNTQPWISATCYERSVALHKHASWWNSRQKSGGKLWGKIRTRDQSGRRLSPKPKSNFSFFIYKATSNPKSDLEVRPNNARLCHGNFVAEFLWIIRLEKAEEKSKTNAAIEAETPAWTN